MPSERRSSHRVLMPKRNSETSLDLFRVLESSLISVESIQRLLEACPDAIKERDNCAYVITHIQ